MCGLLSLHTNSSWDLDYRRLRLSLAPKPPPLAIGWGKGALLVFSYDTFFLLYKQILFFLSLGVVYIHDFYYNNIKNMDQ